MFFNCFAYPLFSFVCEQFMQYAADVVSCNEYALTVTTL